MSKKLNLLGLDVGHVRIGTALGDAGVNLAVPYETIDVDGEEIEKIAEIVIRHEIDVIVVGLPRNQRGDLTKQSEYSQDFSKKLQDMDVEIVFQDESLTSVLAEQQLAARKKPYAKGDIDMVAATLILDDYLERQR